MDSEADINDAIAQLEMLGIERKKAIKALSRYNYNVERAADYVFSGNAESDDGDADISANNTTDQISPNSNALDWPWAEPSSFDTITADQPQPQPQQQQQQQATSQQTSSVTDSTTADQLPVYMVKDYEKIPKQRTDITDVTHDPSSWSVVPFTANDASPATATEPNIKSERPFTQPSLTWWSDPEDPSARVAIADIPAGLRPPSYNFAYSPIIIQALFHVPLFRQAVLSYRPTPHAWGAPHNYWKGFGEPVPGYKLKPSQQNRSSVPASTSASQPSFSPINQNQNQSSSSLHNETSYSMPNLMDLTINDSDKLEEHIPTTDSSSHLAQQIQQDHQEQEPLELITITQETTNAPLPKVDELVPMTKETTALAELQKLFAFLGNTRRLYGSVAHFMRATNARTVTSSTDWQVDDKSIEDFLDSVIGGMVAAENSSNIDQDGNYEEYRSSSLKSMFFLQAEVENGSDTDIEEIYYLNLGINTAMHSFHDCLDPLVYESYPNEAMFGDANDDDDDLGSSTSDDFNGTIPYKLTTFLQVPPLLLITLEDRQDYQQRRMKKDGSFKVEKTIYLDRYLNENKSLVLEKYRIADQWKQDIRRTKLEITALRGDGGSASLPDGLCMNRNNNTNDANCDSSLDKCQILETTAKYLGSQLDAMEATDANLTYINSMRTLQQTLYQVRDDIDNKKKELEQLIVDRQHSLQNLFNDSGLHERPYDLRAVLHTDGLNGTGHYWGYIWVEPSEANLLEDIPAQGGGWHRFCDARVEKVTEEDVWREPTDPFALLYTDRNIPVIYKQQIDDITPLDLMQFVQNDNTDFENEIYNRSNDMNNSDNSSISGNSGDFQQTASRLSMDTDHGSIGYNENGPARYSNDYDDYQYPNDKSNNVRQTESYRKTPDDTNNSSSTSMDELESEQRRHSGTAISARDIQADDSKWAEMAVETIEGIRNCSGDDYRLMKRFDTFLAHAGDKQTLTCYYQLIESSLLATNSDVNVSNMNKTNDDEQDGVHRDKAGGDNQEDPSIGDEKNDVAVGELGNILDTLTLKDIRQAIQKDKTLFLLFELYEQYLSMGQTATMALLLFSDNNFSGALEQILKSNQQHGTWRTQLMLNDTLLWKYRGLGDLGFDDIVLKYGKACIKQLNIEAYNKACNMAYRSRGLQDGIRIANHAQLVMSKVTDPKDQFLSDVGGRWLNFAELQSGSLTDDQVELLNTLVMIYLDGPTATTSTSTATTSTTRTTTSQLEGGLMDTSRLLCEQTDALDAMNEPVWIAFKKSVLDAESKLAALV
ncbi:unnamed protein product [Absidia cylindrospora]